MIKHRDMKTTRIEGVETVEDVFTRMIRDYPTRVVAAAMRRSMRPFIERAKGLNPTFAHLYKVKVFNRKRNIPVVAAGVFGSRKGRKRRKA